MTDIKDFEGFKASLRNFDWLKGVLPGASDWDFVSHASGPFGDRFLLLESKRLGERLSPGQRILIRALERQPAFLVVTVYGPDESGAYFCDSVDSAWKGRHSLDELRALAGTWGWHYSGGRFGTPPSSESEAA